jgi:eukaryotic-like serine/threonine-protein kinase
LALDPSGPPAPFAATAADEVNPSLSLGRCSLLAAAPTGSRAAVRRRGAAAFPPVWCWHILTDRLTDVDSSTTSSIMDVAAQLSTLLGDRYRVEREIGAGGMATVYLAEDLKHRRRVALKVLRPELGAVLGPDRFLAEINVTASLQHPHLLPLFDSGEAGGLLYYVMPWVEGESLRDRLQRERQLPVDEAVRIAAAVLSALDYAHRQGVVHRDLKPENILLHDGQPLVADFGIALAVSIAGGARVTQTGLSLGTPQYMSPEQATGDRVIDARSDIYSLAAVLYEMLTGDPPHSASTTQAIIARILTESPASVRTFRSSVPQHVDAAILYALAKLPADRFATAGEFADALSGRRAVAGLPLPAAAAAGRGAGVGTRRAAWGAAALLLVLAVAGWWPRAPAPSPTLRLDLTPGPAGVVPVGDIVVSADGSTLAFAGRLGTGPTAIYVRRLDRDPNFVALPGTASALSPDFSPDGRWIAFTRGSGGGISKVSADGGGVTSVTSRSGFYYPHWGTQDRIVFSSPAGSFIAPAAGGEPELLEGLETRRPFLLPDGSGVLGTADSGVVLYDLGTKAVTPLIAAGMHPVYAASGHLLYLDDGGGLFAVPFDLERHRVAGAPVRLIERVAATLGARGYAVSRTGTLVQHEGAATTRSEDTHLVIGDANGALDTLPLPRARRVAPRFSRDGRFIVFSQTHPTDARAEGLFTFDLVTGTMRRVLPPENLFSAIWSPDGTRLLYHIATGDSSREMRIRSLADDSDTLLLATDGRVYPSDWPRSDVVLFGVRSAGQEDLLTMTPTPGARPRTYLAAPWDERDAALSPDGRFAVFSTREDGVFNIWIRDFPDPTGKWRVSANGGEVPRWARDGKHVYFMQPSAGGRSATLMRARVDLTPAIRVGAPEAVVSLGVAAPQWDLHPDGLQFVAALRDEAVTGTGAASGDATRHLLHLNWFTELWAAFRLQEAR